MAPGPLIIATGYSNPLNAFKSGWAGSVTQNSKHDAKRAGGTRARQSRAHKAWISELLIGYYDPMYEYQMNNRTKAPCSEAPRAR